MSNDLRNFLALTYEELEERNLAVKEQRKKRVPAHQLQEERIKDLADEKRLKAVTVLFSDLEGRLHMLDYDKKFLVKSFDNLTFDGSSIRGFTAQKESDLRLGIDWSSFYWVPADLLGSGKVFVFGQVIDKQGGPYEADLRSVLKEYADKLYAEKGYTLNAANEIEGFLFAGKDAERHFHQNGRFDYVNTGGYYHSLPGDPLRTFIDTAAEVQETTTRDGNALLASFDQHVTALRSIRRSEGFYGAVERLQLSLNALQGLMAKEAQTPGRKVVIWLSPGWPIFAGPQLDLTTKEYNKSNSIIVGLEAEEKRLEDELAKIKAQLQVARTDSAPLSSAIDQHRTEVTKAIRAVKNQMSLVDPVPSSNAADERIIASVESILASAVLAVYGIIM